ncbi:MAG: ABC transporter permease [Tissierellia bacterium]|nr:ABC transporter permease [Tissierellia bacterium]
MFMIIRKLRNIIRDGFKGLWRNGGTAFASIVSIAAVLVILGILLIFVLSVNNFVEDSRRKLDEVQIFLLDEATEDQVATIKSKLENNDGVGSITYVSKVDAMNKTKEEWGENADILDGLGFNPYPASFVLHISELDKADEIVDSIKDLPGIEKVQYLKDTIETVSKIGFYIRYGGLFFTALLSFISILIISNTIKITVASRSREINIMKYLGATNGYIRSPFILEGLLIGLIGGVIALCVVYFGYEFFFDKINHSLFSMVAINLVAPVGLFMDLLILYITIGMGIGALGSFISVKRFLNV